VLLRWAAHHYLTGRDGLESFFQRARKVRLPALAEPGSEHQAELDALFATLNDARILTLVRDGAWGCTGINRFLDLEFRRQLGTGGRGRLLAGSAVLITANDYNLQLFNGDVGLALESAAGGYRVVFPRLGSYLSVPMDALPAHELAFAMTVHKAQGSEYGQVLLTLPPATGRRLLTKEMIYTGMTRARNLAVVCSSAEVLRTAISRRVEREANLLEWADLASTDP
jgi:exodeoxyribonuclease V alpha subunit